MKVIDFDGVHEASTDGDLETILKRRHGIGVNSFWLSHGTDTYPTLSLLVRGDLATLTFMPRENDAGFSSVGKMPELKSSETTTFAISYNRADDVVVLNDAVLPFPVALQAAKEFFFSKDLPRSVEWQKL
jgi:hypothetical protein